MANYSRYAPAFELQINDAQLPAAVRTLITSVRYEDGRNAADRVEVDFANANLRLLQNHIKGLGFQPFPTALTIGPLGKLSAMPAGTFDLDNKLSLKMGYAADGLADMFLGEVTGVEASFPSGGMPTMSLVAHDLLHRLSQGSSARGFGPLADALVVIILGAENRLLSAIDPAITAISAVLMVENILFAGTGAKQAARGKGQSDLELLTKIAKRYDADFWVDGDVLYLSRFVQKDYSPRLTLTWGESLLEFNPHVSTIGQVAGVSMKFTLREIPLSFLVTIFYDFDKESVGMSVVPGPAAAAAKAFSGPSFTIIDQPISCPVDIANSALIILRRLREKLNKRLTGKGSAVGDPRIRAGAMIRIEGVGTDFSGDYRVSNASHTLSTDGYKTNFEVFKEIIP
jgi:phage protein D